MSKRLSPEQQKNIGQEAISEGNISHIAQYHQVSRNTVYAQQRRARSALDDEFLPSTQDEKVLFYLPVTKGMIGQIIIDLLMICKASYRDSLLFLRDVFDIDINLGTLYNIHNTACQKAMDINSTYSLGAIQQSASDEIFHRNKPHLAVVDIRSRYCASLSCEVKRDTDTWSIHLLDLIEQGFQPDVNISDHGSGMTKAFKDVLPNTEHRFDHFHLIKSGKDLVRYLKNMKESAITRQIKVLEKMEKAKLKNKGNTLSTKLVQVTREAAHAESLYQHVCTLFSWLQVDILQMAGYPPKEREDLFSFVLTELSSVAESSDRIRSFVTSLSNQKESLLAASHVLNNEFQKIAICYGITLQDVWDICYVTRYDIQTLNYHNKADELASCIGSSFDQVEDEVLSVIASTPRCSSMVENFNSRLRPYLDARKQITSESLDLIRFYLNHQVFLRSEHDYMRGKTPAEVLTNTLHSNWLEMLGFKCFKRSARAA